MDSDGEQVSFDMLSSSDRQSEFQGHHYPNYRHHSYQNYFNHDEDELYKALPPTGFVSNQPYQLDQSPSGCDECYKRSKEGLFKLRSERKKRFIQVSRKSKQRYLVCKKGNKRQTSLLNINFKTYLSSLLREYLIFTRVNEYEQEKISEFFNSKANFTSFQRLYGVYDHQETKQKETSSKVPQVTIRKSHDKLRRFLIGRFQKGEFIRKILTNKKMSYENKASIIKFSTQIRKSCINPEAFSIWKTCGMI